MAIKNTVSSDLSSAFVDSGHFRLPQFQCLVGVGKEDNY